MDTFRDFGDNSINKIFQVIIDEIRTDLTELWNIFEKRAE